MGQTRHLPLFSVLLLVTLIPPTLTTCPADPPNCPGIRNGIQQSANSTHIIAGVFSVSAWRVKASDTRNQDCSLCADSRLTDGSGSAPVRGPAASRPAGSSTVSRTLRFAVEQSEALILATQQLNDATFSHFGYDITDSCGNHFGTDCIQTLDPMSTTLATIVGPYYADASVSLDNSEVLSIFSRLGATNSSTGRLIFSLLDVPFSYTQAMRPFATGKGSAQVIMLQPSCELQALAAVDFVARVEWLDVTVIGSGDACGTAALRVFKEELDRKGIACHFEVRHACLLASYPWCATSECI